MENLHQMIPSSWNRTITLMSTPRQYFVYLHDDEIISIFKTESEGEKMRQNQTSKRARADSNWQATAALLPCITKRFCNIDYYPTFSLFKTNFFELYMYIFSFANNEMHFLLLFDLKSYELKILTFMFPMLQK